MIICRPIKGICGFSRETVIAFTTNIESIEFRRRENDSHGFAEHPRARTKDDVEAFFGLLHRFLGLKTFLNLKVADQPSLRSRSTTENTTRVVIPFKDQESANIVTTHLSVKLQTSVQPVFTSRKIAQEFSTTEPKPQLIDQQCVVYNFKCDQCDAGYVGYTRGHLFVRVDNRHAELLLKSHI